LLRGAERTEDAPIKTVPGGDPGAVVDAEIANIAKEKRSTSNGFDDVGGVHGGTSDDGDQAERVEV
jgi:hypothetical protein